MIFGVDFGSLGFGICGIALLCVGLFVLGAYLLLRFINYWFAGSGRVPRRKVDRQVQRAAYEDPFARAEDDFEIALRQAHGVQPSAPPQAAYNAQNMPIPPNPALNPNQAPSYRKPSLSAGRAYVPPAAPQFPPPNPNFGAPPPSVAPQFPPPNPNFGAPPPRFTPPAPNFGETPSDNPLGDLPPPPALRDQRAAQRPRRDDSQEYYDEWSGNLFN